MTFWCLEWRQLALCLLMLQFALAVPADKNGLNNIEDDHHFLEIQPSFEDNLDNEIEPRNYRKPSIAAISQDDLGNVHASNQGALEESLGSLHRPSRDASAYSNKVLWNNPVDRQFHQISTKRSFELLKRTKRMSQEQNNGKGDKRSQMEHDNLSEQSSLTLKKNYKNAAKAGKRDSNIANYLSLRDKFPNTSLGPTNHLKPPGYPALNNLNQNLATTNNKQISNSKMLEYILKDLGLSSLLDLTTALTDLEKLDIYDKLLQSILVSKSRLGIPLFPGINIVGIDNAIINSKPSQSSNSNSQQQSSNVHNQQQSSYETYQQQSSIGNNQQQGSTGNNQQQTSQSSYYNIQLHQFLDNLANKGVPSASYGVPTATYGAPTATYVAPTATYGAPSATYAAPSATYGAPSATYAAPSATYGAPSVTNAGSSYGSKGQAIRPYGTNKGNLGTKTVLVRQDYYHLPSVYPTILQKTIVVSLATAG